MCRENGVSMTNLTCCVFVLLGIGGGIEDALVGQPIDDGNRARRVAAPDREIALVEGAPGKAGPERESGGSKLSSL